MSLFVFGLGYSASAVVARGGFGPVAGTTRSRERVEGWRAEGVDAFLFDGTQVDAGLPEALARARTLLATAAPDQEGDPALRAFANAIAAAPRLERILYLSTVGVYGGSDGAWVSEASPTLAASPRAKARLAAEAAWRDLGARRKIPVDVLRLAGIYGPGRSPLAKARAGTARRIVKPGQVFNRIHAEDIAGAVAALVERGGPGDVWNVADGSPAPPQDVVAYAAELLQMPPPPEEPFERAEMSPMARSFYEDNRRISVDKLLATGWRPIYPSYREGLLSLSQADAPD